MEMFKLYPYTVPKWAAHLNGIPKVYVKLSDLNTPIHEWNLPGVPEGFKIHIKRDDLTGTELSGNKVRNLQLYFADALTSGCSHVVTGGGPQSGHCRAVSLVARYLGIKPHVVIEGVEKADELGTKGNTLLYRMAGSQLYLAPYEGYEQFVKRVQTMKDYISREYGEPCYYIPVGGSSLTGVYGFISLFEELMHQVLKHFDAKDQYCTLVKGLYDRFDDIVVAVATGGTATGLAVGNYLNGSKVKIHALSVGLTKECLTFQIDVLLDQLGIDSVKTGDILDIIYDTEYLGDGYGTVRDDVLEYITKVSSSTGILLDPYYTGKCTSGMVKEMASNPGRFQGKRILFIHTGGIFGLFNGEMDRVLNKEGAVTNNMRPWPDMDSSPL